MSGWDDSDKKHDAKEETVMPENAGKKTDQIQKTVSLETAFKSAIQHHKAGRLRQAENIYRQILKAQPDNPDAWHLLGLMAHQAGNINTAVELIGKAVHLDPNRAQFFRSLGDALKAQGNPDDAIASFERATEIKPDYAKAHLDLGNLLREHGRLDDAAAGCQRAIEIDPDYTDAYTSLGAAFYGQGKLDDAVASYRKALATNPKDPASIKVRLFLSLPIVAQSKEQIIFHREQIKTSIEELCSQDVRIEDPSKTVGLTSFFLAYHGFNDKTLQRQIARFYLRACPSLGWIAPHCRTRYGGPEGRRVRLGIASAYLRNHTIGTLNCGIVERLSRDRFEVIVLRPFGDHDDMAERINSAADKVVRFPRDLAVAREQIAGEELDILFYTDIGMAPLTYFLAFARLAPVQCVTWGHPVTTGIPNMDYFVSSVDLEPPDAEDHYSERLIRLKRLSVYYYRPEVPEPRPTRAQFGLPDDATLYVCPQSLFKFHPDFDGALGALLQRDPKGLLVLISGVPVHCDTVLQNRFAQAFPDACDRVVFLPRMGQQDFLRLLAVADALLDPPYFGGGNTSYQGLAIGTPIVTWPGPFMRGRVTLACYKALGVMDLVASDGQSYVELAYRLANDHGWREEVAARIKSRIHVLFEDLEAVRELERFFEQAVANANPNNRIL